MIVEPGALPQAVREAMRGQADVLSDGGQQKSALEPAVISRRRACRPGARPRRRAMLAETPRPPRVPRVRFPR